MAHECENKGNDSNKLIIIKSIELLFHYYRDCRNTRYYEYLGRTEDSTEEKVGPIG